MVSQGSTVSETEARGRLDEFLRRHFGADLTHPGLGPVVVLEQYSRERENAFLFAVNTKRFVETGDVRDGLMSGAVVVPKDGSPVHWAPTMPPLEEYLESVATGEQWWSGGGAAPVTEIRYYARIAPGETPADPSGIVRRRTADGRTVDEAYTRSLRWEPTEYFEKYALGHNDDDHVEITAAEAADFVRLVRKKLSS